MTTAAVRYRLAMPEPPTHLLHVEIRLPSVSGRVDLAMASWTPGSYLLREFPRHVQQFAAATGAGAPLRWSKRDKNTWRVEAADGDEVVVRYVVYANDLTVRTSHLDASHGYVNGASVFMAVHGRTAEAAEVEIDAPAGWTVTTALEAAEGDHRFRARSFSHLVDSPIEIGTHETIPFDACGRPHEYAIWGRGNVDRDRLVADTRRIVETAERFWGGLPYDRYTLFLHLVPGGRGGLEHRESTSLHADPDAFRGREYEQFLALVTHEFFHTWNGTRIRPEPLVDPDLRRENYTRNLWVVEGLTTYYTEVLLRRAGLVDADRFLERIGDLVQRHLQTPGRHVQTLADSSFDTWIKFYRPDEHSPNSQISYYLKGALVGLLLDIRIRGASGHTRSLDDVMRLLWERFGAHDVGYPEETTAGIQRVAEEVCGEPLDGFFERYVFGLDELPLEDALGVLGLRVRRSGASLAERTAPVGSGGDPAGRFGVRLEPHEGRAVVAHVRAGSAAYRAGLNARDELVSLDGRRVTPSDLSRRLQALRSGERVRVGVFRRGEWVDVEAEGSDDLSFVRLEQDPNASDDACAAFADWARDG